MNTFARSTLKALPRTGTQVLPQNPPEPPALAQSSHNRPARRTVWQVRWLSAQTALRMQGGGSHPRLLPLPSATTLSFAQPGRPNHARPCPSHPCPSHRKSHLSATIYRCQPDFREPHGPSKILHWLLPTHVIRRAGPTSPSCGLILSVSSPLQLLGAAVTAGAIAAATAFGADHSNAVREPALSSHSP